MTLHRNFPKTEREEPRFPNQTARSLGVILTDSTMLIPDDLSLIQSLTNDYQCTREDLLELIDSGWLLRVVVGKEPHLALRSGKRRVSMPVACTSSSLGSSDEAFRERVLIDAESERIVLYRVAIVVQAVAAMMLTRSLLLY